MSDTITTLTTTADLARFCAAAASHPYVTIDTEFLRERTYYAQLCLIQMAVPGEGPESAVLVDPLVDGLDLKPFYDLMADERVVKVFHAARQDLEIIYIEGGGIPAPLFDTQVAAMVCGYGDQVGYETLVKSICKTGLDKSSRFTDWSRRPLSIAQQSYALGDVTHLRVIYEKLTSSLEQTGRLPWVQEEMAILTDPATYEVKPENAWQRLRLRTNVPRFVAVAQELACFRERHAQTNNIPRNRVFKDDALMELASTKPREMKDLGKSRLLLREARKGVIAEGILAAVNAAMAIPNDELPKVPRGKERAQINGALADLLRVLLKAKAEEAGVAQKLIASASDLDDIASGDLSGPWRDGWRGDVFGTDALRLIQGEVALACAGPRIKLVDL